MNAFNSQVFAGILVASVEFFCYHTDILENEFKKCKQPADLLAANSAVKLRAIYATTVSQLQTKALFDFEVDSIFVTSCQAIKDLLKTDVLPLVEVVSGVKEVHVGKSHWQLILDALDDSQALPFSVKYSDDFAKFVTARAVLNEWIQDIKAQFPVLNDMYWSRAGKVVNYA
jgi:hypothetical protein